MIGMVIAAFVVFTIILLVVGVLLFASVEIMRKLKN